MVFLSSPKCRSTNYWEMTVEAKAVELSSTAPSFWFVAFWWRGYRHNNNYQRLLAFTNACNGGRSDFELDRKRQETETVPCQIQRENMEIKKKNSKHVQTFACRNLDKTNNASDSIRGSNAHTTRRTHVDTSMTRQQPPCNWHAFPGLYCSRQDHPWKNLSVPSSQDITPTTRATGLAAPNHYTAGSRTRDTENVNSTYFSNLCRTSADKDRVPEVAGLWRVAILNKNNKKKEESHAWGAASSSNRQQSFHSLLVLRKKAGQIQTQTIPHQIIFADQDYCACILGGPKTDFLVGVLL